MTLTKRHAWLAFALAAWNVIIWVRFIFALTDDKTPEPTGFYVAHSILIVINLLIALGLTVWGVRILRSLRGSAVEG